MYTTIKHVRSMSGFDDTTHITDERIVRQIKIATSMINSAIGYNYTLPLPYHFSCAIEFQGLATGSGTMAIVINGVTYNVAVVASDNTTTIADKFRIAVADSAHFVADEIGSGATVTIVSKTDSASVATAYAEVNVTAAPATEWISAVVGTRLKRVVPIIEQMTTQIATALLFIDIYGVESQDTGKDGAARMAAVNEDLQKLQGVHESGQRIILFDEVTNEELPVSWVAECSSYPNDTSDVSTTDNTSPKVWVNQVF